ncbi:MAG: hypothetical protein ACIAZJ_10280 [Gimesia chilikensis]|uniref:hypothetical protein n=1 Tax=Gimesia chilikensis TaxID=2605989 RepID=UPI0037999473
MADKKESKTIRFPVFVVLLLLLAYVLSIGPVVALMTDSQWNTLYPEYSGVVEVFYAPVGLIGNMNATLRSCFSAYIDFFVQRF